MEWVHAISRNKRAVGNKDKEGDQDHSMKGQICYIRAQIIPCSQWRVNIVIS